MQFSLVVQCYDKIEATTKRLEMTDYLVELFRLTPGEIVTKVVYLTQGKLYPDFANIEIGIAEKLAIQAVAKATGESEKEIVGQLAKTGDIGETAEKLLTVKPQASLFSGLPLTVEEVYEVLDKVAKAYGSGSMTRKLSLLAGLLARSTPQEAKYVIRIATGSLRMGIADMTVLDALAIAYGGGKEARDAIERAYNISSDLGTVARVVAEQGMEGIYGFKVLLGSPIRPMLAERLGSLDEILEKLDGKCMAEYKYDGERVQAHKDSDIVTLFSRRLENITSQYPDVAELVSKNIRSKTAIIEAECVAVDPHSGELKPFQELMHRRRKHGVTKAMAEYPVTLFAFDLLFADGEDFTLTPYMQRRQKLKHILTQTPQMKTTESKIVGTVAELEVFLENAMESGCEGLICKSMADDAFYQAGARGWAWIKFKQDYSSEMTDTVDLVVVGAFHGRGKRAGTYGALLLASYNPVKDIYETVTKCGTGFTDEDLQKIPKIMNKHRLSKKASKVASTLKADVWFEPNTVLEVRGSEVTLSPIHTCAINAVRKGSGLAIRFPRFTGKYRLDKRAEDATTSSEILEMYQAQLKQL